MGKAQFLTYLLWAYICCSSQLSHAQTPPLGLEGEALRTWIRDEFFVGSHRTLNYGLARDSAFAFIDNRDGTILSVYGGYPYSWPKGFVGSAPTSQNNGNLLDLEHTVPQSFYNESLPMVSDLHQLFPSLHKWNSTRSNYPFIEIPDQKTTKWMRLDQEKASIPITNIEEYSELFERSFEPREDHKGNCARAIFYFFTVYPPTIYSSLEVDIQAIGDINTLFQWHIEDSVDAAEIQRNDHIERLQGNRNPFIDHPEWVVDAWEINKTPLPAPANFSLFERPNSIEIRWEDLNHEIRYYLYRSSDNIHFERLASIPKDSTYYNDDTVEPNTVYHYYLVGFNGGGVSVSTDTLSGQLTDRNALVDIFFSEYVEGSSLNKALEIANFTGSTVELSTYSIKTQKNGSGVWESSLNLNGSLENGDVWVVANSQADESLLERADTTLISDIVSFNGNDVLGLFKNNELIDIIGFQASSDNFGKNITLVRDPSIYSPNIVYIPDEWLEFSSNTFEYVGAHVASTSISSLQSFDHIKLYPNPFKDQLFLESSGYSHEYQQAIFDLYNMQGQKIELPQSEYNQTGAAYRYVFDTNSLPKGAYVLKLYVGQTVQSNIIVKH